jgi:hypothetical protein
MLLLTIGGLVVTAQAARTTKALTAAQATACIQTAVAERTGMVTKVEVAEKRGQRLCEVSIVDDSGKKYTLRDRCEHPSVGQDQVREQDVHRWFSPTMTKTRHPGR